MNKILNLASIWAQISIIEIFAQWLRQLLWEKFYNSPVKYYIKTFHLFLHCRYNYGLYYTL